MGWLSKLLPRASAAAPAPAPASAPVGDYEAHTAQGSRFLDQGRAADAVVEFQKAAALEPQRAGAHINLGFALFEAGELAAAQAALTEADRLSPQNFDVFFMRAQIAQAQGDLALSESLVLQALSITPQAAPALSLLNRLYVAQGRFAELEQRLRKHAAADVSEADLQAALASALAAASSAAPERQPVLDMALGHLNRALELNPKLVEPWLDKGLLLIARQETKAALHCFEQAIALKPDWIRAHYFAGKAEEILNRLPEALKHFEAALALDAKDFDALKAAGDANYKLGEFEKAEAYFRQRADLDENSVDSLIMLAAALSEQERYADAMPYSDRTIEMRPDSPEVQFARGNVLNSAADYTGALACYQKALALRPGYADAQNNLCSVLLALGRNAEALEQYQALAEAEPHNLTALSNVCYTASIDPGTKIEDYMRYARAFGAAAAAAVATPYRHARRALAPEHCLKVGLVSGDFCMHPVGLFLERVISLLNTDKIELHAFSNRIRRDPLQASLMQRFASWTSIVGISDEEAAKTIHAAQLDLLIDLSGHTHLNRLGLFAYQAAPVQLSWLGYWASTGVAEIDFLMTDLYSVPPERADQMTEKAWYMPDTRLCFSPPTTVYQMLPERKAGFKQYPLTFGCYQGLRKISDEALTAWSTILKQCPGSQLRLQGSGYAAPQVRDTVLQRLARFGIAAERVALHDTMKRVDYLKSHAEVDILLDTFPYPGGTTTCDALWMGVPTVTLAGPTLLSRQGASMLVCAGLSHWIAKDIDDYIAIAVRQARDLEGLQTLRKELRQRVFDSPLFNAPRFAANLETELRAMVVDKLARLPA